MEFTEYGVRRYIAEANEILTDWVEDYIEPVIKEVKITRARSYWMTIEHIQGDEYTIRVSDLFHDIDDPELFRERMRSSCMHELIHTIDGCWNHGSKFKTICNHINYHFPEYKLATSTAGSNYGVMEAETPIKYIIKCNHCGAISRYRRAPNHLKIFNAIYSCSNCSHSDFNIQKVR